MPVSWRALFCRHEWVNIETGELVDRCVVAKYDVYCPGCGTTRLNKAKRDLASQLARRELEVAHAKILRAMEARYLGSPEGDEGALSLTGQSPESASRDDSRR